MSLVQSASARVGVVVVAVVVGVVVVVVVVDVMMVVVDVVVVICGHRGSRLVPAHNKNSHPGVQYI